MPGLFRHPPRPRQRGPSIVPLLPNVVVTRDWQWYTDATPDGSMSALAAVNTAPTLTAAQEQNGIIRLRTQLYGTGTGAITLEFSADAGTTWLALQEQSPASNQQGVWMRYGNGAATAGATIGTQLLAGTTASGKYHEDGTTSETISSAIQEIDVAVFVHWPAPDTTILFRISQGGVALANDAGETYASFATSTAFVRTDSIVRLDPDGSTANSRELRFAPWRRVRYANGNWWFFSVFVTTPTIIAPYYWDGSSGAWTAATTKTMTGDGQQGRNAYVFANIGGTEVVHAVHGNSSATMRGVRGVLNSDGTITWDSEWSVANTGSATYRHIALTDDFRPYAVGLHASTDVWAQRATNVDSGSSWTSGWGTAATLADAAVLSGHVVSAIGIGTDKILMIWHSGSTAAGVLKSVPVTGPTPTFGTAVTVNTTAVAGQRDWGYARKGNFIFLVHSDSSSAGGNWILRVYSISGDTWSTGTSPGVSGSSSNDDGLPVTVDPASNTIYVCGTFTGSGTQADRKIQYKAYTWNDGSEASGTWSSLTDLDDAGGRGNGDDLSAAETLADGKYLVAWSFGDQGVAQFPTTAEYHFTPAGRVVFVSWYRPLLAQ